MQPKGWILIMQQLGVMEKQKLLPFLFLGFREVLQMEN